MRAHFRLSTKSEDLGRLVGDFARGLGCTLEAPATAGTLRVQLPDGADTLLNLLSYVALAAMKIQLDLQEPLCEVTYREGTAASEVTLALRIADIRLQAPAAT